MQKNLTYGHLNTLQVPGNLKDHFLFHLVLTVGVEMKMESHIN